MKRREFLQATAASLLMASQNGYAQSIGQTIGDAALRLNPAIWPEERVEKREYDNSRPDVVVWKETVRIYAASDPLGYGLPKNERGERVDRQMTGFVEKLATPDYLPIISPPLVRRDIPQSSDPGFYFFFLGRVFRLKLPRTSLGKRDSPVERYAYSDARDILGYGAFLYGDQQFPKDWVCFDYREIKIIEGERIYKPTGELWSGGGNRIYDTPVNRPICYPGSNFKHGKIDIGAIMRFDIAHRPLRFKVELPPLIIQGIEIPLPVCYFEPFDVVNNKWVD